MSMDAPAERRSCAEEIHLTLENPDHSCFAGLISYIVLMTIMGSTVIFVLESYAAWAASEQLELYEFLAVVIFSVEYVMRFLFHRVGGSTRGTQWHRTCILAPPVH